jgi:hypothetical protein
MQAGHAIIVQAAAHDGNWVGGADILLPVETSSALGSLRQGSCSPIRCRATFVQMDRTRTSSARAAVSASANPEFFSIWGREARHPRFGWRRERIWGRTFSAEPAVIRITGIGHHLTAWPKRSRLASPLGGRGGGGGFCGRSRHQIDDVDRGRCPTA